MNKKVVNCTAILTVCLMIFGGTVVAAEPTALETWRGNELTEDQLADIQGESWGIVVAGAIIGAVDFAITNWDEEKDTDWYVRGGTAMVAGAVLAGTGTVLSNTAKSWIAEGAIYTYSWAKERLTQWALSFNDDHAEDQKIAE